ncbi:MAG: signal peptidase I [Kangiellaceae bacterium]|nr:signal peptidase I [Kangiellaceae bacterium]
MSSYYGLILVLLTFVSGIIWLIDAFTAGKKRKAAVAKLYEQTEEPSKEAIEAVSQEPIYVDYAKSFFPILFIIVVLRSFLYEPFQIPSASMKPTLTEGDFILVNKFNYGLRLPVTSDKVVDIGLPQRGDVAVFKAPHKPHEDYIKRVIGLPGDTVIYTYNKELIIIPYCRPELKKSDCPQKIMVSRTPADEPKYLDIAPGAEVGTETLHFVENIAGAEHGILIDPNKDERNKFPPMRSRKMRVPQGHYFVMGDNRDNSFDGRYWVETNFVPEEMLVGQAVSIWLHLDFDITTKGLTWIPTGIDIGRIGSIK